MSEGYTRKEILELLTANQVRSDRILDRLIKLRYVSLVSAMLMGITVGALVGVLVTLASVECA